MKLIELDPRWLINKDGKRVGFVFLCPEDKKNMGPKPWYQSCVFDYIPRQEQWALFNVALRDLAHGDDADDQYARVQGCNPMAKWTYQPMSGDVELDIGIERHALDFNTITVQPSIDGSAGGLWHGFIRNGEIVFLR